jgi:hypothetical protein
MRSEIASQKAAQESPTLAMTREKMKSLRVLLIHRDNCNYRNLTGWWSYPTAEFTWEAMKVKEAGFEARVERGKYDLAVMDDWIFGTVEKQGTPLAYVVVDSARSAGQLCRNQGQAAQADLILVDSDELWKFKLGKAARRFAYAVNEKLYYPRTKEYDVAFLCWPTEARRAVCEQAREICGRHGWSFLTGTYVNYWDYAAAIGSARVVVHKAHVEKARSWRVFDVMASGGCLLSSPLPRVEGDGIEEGVHYAVYQDGEGMEEELERLLGVDDGRRQSTPLWTIDNRCEGLFDRRGWARMARRGYELVMERHTWKVRARELREIIHEELGI